MKDCGYVWLNAVNKPVNKPLINYVCMWLAGGYYLLKVLKDAVCIKPILFDFILAKLKHKPG